MLLTRRAALGGAISFATIGAAAAKSAATIRIGLQCDLTGSLAHGGYWRKKATDAAVDRLNRSGGIGGRPVELLTVDTGSDVDAGMMQLRRLVDDLRVDFVIGARHDELARRSSLFMHDRKAIYISMSRTEETPEIVPSPYIFRLTPSARSTTMAAKQMLGMTGKKWAVIHSDDPWGQTNRDVWAQQAALTGADVVQSIAVSSNANVLGAIAKLKEADGVFMALLGPELPKAFLSLVQLGLAGKPIVAADSVFGAVDVRSYGQRARNMWGIDTLPWRLSDKDTPAIRQLRSAVGIDPSGREVNTGRHVAVGDVWTAWQSVSFLKTNVEGANWRTTEDALAFIRNAETKPDYAESDLFPQGPFYVRPQDHRAFCDTYLLRVDDGAIAVRGVIPLADGIYPARFNVVSK